MLKATKGSYDDIWIFYRNISMWSWLEGQVYYRGALKNGTKGEFSKTFSPGPRHGFSKWIDSQHNLWIFGGYLMLPVSDSNNKVEVLMSDLWCMNGFIWSWIDGPLESNLYNNYNTSIFNEDVIVGSRAYTSTWLLNDTYFYMFGGYGYGYNNNNNGTKECLGEMWVYNKTNNKWKNIGGIGNEEGEYGKYKYGNIGVEESDNWPPNRMGSVSWLLNNKMYLFGGASQFEDTTLNDLWLFNPVNNYWTWISGDPYLYLDRPYKFSYYGTKGIESDLNKVGSRWLSSSFTLYNINNNNNNNNNEDDGDNYLYLYGGEGFTTTKIGYLQDLWRFNTKTNKWTWIDGTNTTITNNNFQYPNKGNKENKENISPPNRIRSCVTVINNTNVYLFGGSNFNNSYYFSDIWLLNTSYYNINETDNENNLISNNNNNNNNNNNVTIIVTVIVVVVVIITSVLILFFIIRRRKQRTNKDDKYETSTNNSIEMNKNNHNYYGTKLSETNNSNENNNKNSSDGVYGNYLKEISKVEVNPLKDIIIINKLGNGNYGEVYSGKWNQTTDVALKKLKSKEQYKEFITEATLLFSLSHPNVVQYFGIFQQNSDNFIVMEMMSKGDLKSLLIQLENKITQTTIINMLKQAAIGISYLHEKNIIHRDIALRNLLVNVEGENYVVKISDFGMSRTVSNSDYYTSTSDVVPVRWISLESLKFNKYSIRSDVWSFGIVMWEIFSNGAHPYFGLTNAETADKVTSGYRLPIPISCPDNYYELMLSCWHESPEKRPTMKSIVEKL